MSRKVLLRISVIVLVLFSILLFFRLSHRKGKVSESAARPTDFASQPADTSANHADGSVPGRGPKMVIFGTSRTVEQCAPAPKVADSTAQSAQ